MKRIAVLAVLACATSALAADRAPVLANTTGKTIIRRLAPGNDISMVVVSKAGTAVFLDPRTTKVVPDLVAITHAHHRDAAYLALAKDARIVDQQVGTVTVKDVKLTGIAASHAASPEIKSPPDHVVYLVEVDGLRIGYLACTSPKALTPEQLAVLGTLDVAMISTETESDGRNTRRNYEVVKATHPKIILTLSHHIGDYEYALDQIADAGGKVEHVKDPLALDPASLKGAGERVVNLLATAPAN